MAEPSLITAYLTELRLELTQQDGVSAHAIDAEIDDLVDECADHLNTKADALVRAGSRRRDAELSALAHYGSPALIARLEAAERRKGAAVPTTFTRLAGVAGMSVPALVAIGAAANEAWPLGALHAVVATSWVAAFAAFVVFFVGLVARHRGALGRHGTAAVVVFAAAPFLSLPFGWAAPLAWGALISVSLALLTWRMWQAAALPRVPIAILGITGPVTLGIAYVGTVLGHDMGNVAPLGAMVLVGDVVVLGVLMAREVALARHSGGSPDGAILA